MEGPTMTTVLHPALSAPWRPGFQIHNEAFGKTVRQCVECSWQVRVACENGHSRVWNANEIGQAFPLDVTLNDIAERLRCKVCGSAEGSLTIRNDIGETQRRDIERSEGMRLGADGAPEAG